MCRHCRVGCRACRACRACHSDMGVDRVDRHQGSFKDMYAYHGVEVTMCYYSVYGSHMCTISSSIVGGLHRCNWLPSEVSEVTITITAHKSVLIKISRTLQVSLRALFFKVHSQWSAPQTISHQALGSHATRPQHQRRVQRHAIRLPGSPGVARRDGEQHAQQC